MVFVRDVRWPQQNVARCCFDLFVTNGEQRVPVADDENFVVWMNVPERPGSDFIRAIEQDGHFRPDVLSLNVSLPELIV